MKFQQPLDFLRQLIFRCNRCRRRYDPLLWLRPSANKPLNMTEIVIDKDFLDGAPTEHVKRLCEDNVVLFSQTLLFELMTTSKKSQKRCFSKLPDETNPVTLIPPVGTLLRYELENGIASTPLVDHAINENFKFNGQLREGTYIAEGDIKQALEEWKRQVKEDTENFRLRCSIVHQFFPELNGIEYKRFLPAIDDARKRIAENHDHVRAIYKAFLDENAPTNAPPPESLDSSWAFFRWVQCQVLSSLRMFGKYQGKFESPASGKVFERAEHTMHDVYYTILATLSGAVATGDQEIIDDFFLVCPIGVLIRNRLTENFSRAPASATDFNVKITVH